MKRFFRLFLICITVLIGNAVQAAQATYDAATGNLTLDSVTLSNNVTYNNVVIRLSSLGQVAVNDPAVGGNISFNLNTFTLNLPSVTVGGQTFQKVSLKGPAFTLLSVNGIVVNGGTSGSYNLDLAITASGIAAPAIRIENVPKPASQAEFCSEDIYKQFQQNVQGFTGTWRVTGCTFSGNVGNISAELTITSPISMSIPYLVKYTYSAR